jgi:hypothetical protein
MGGCLLNEINESAYPLAAEEIAADARTAVPVESRMGAVALGLWPLLRFPSPLIEPDLRSYRIRLSGWLHCEAHGGAFSGKRSRRKRPRL